MATSTDSLLLGDPNLDAQVYGRDACPYTGRVRRLLRDQGLASDYIDLDLPQNRQLAALLRSETGQSSVPYVFVRGRFVGGFDELDEEVRLGQLSTAPGGRVSVLAPPAEPTPRARAIELRASLPEDARARRPSRPTTHEPASPMKLMELGLAVEEEAQGEPVSVELLEEVAADNGARVELVFAGAALIEGVAFERTTDVCFRVCTGQCQSWGALERLEHLIGLRREDRGDGKANFDIEAVECLSRCELAPAVVVETQIGVAGLDAARDTDLTEAVQQLCAFLRDEQSSADS